MRKRIMVVLAALLFLGVGLTEGQSASAAAVTSHGSSVGAHAMAVPPAAVRGAAPAGCPSGDVCFYFQGNGGDLCGYTNANSYNLGSGPGGLAPYGNHCENIGPSGSIYNNGTTCSGCQDVKLYYDQGYGGAWYCLPKGSYLLFIEQNHFNGGGSGADGYGQTLAFDPQPPYGPGPGGVASAKWTSC